MSETILEARYRKRWDTPGELQAASLAAWDIDIGPPPFQYHRPKDGTSWE